MLVRPTRQFPGTTFLFRGSALSRVWPWLVLLLLWSSVLTYFHLWFQDHALTFTTTPFTILGVAVSIFLGFRNNACYDRWWEARKLWGRLINTSRTFTRQVLTVADADPVMARNLVYRTIAFAHVLRLHLREQLSDLSVLEGLLPTAEIEALRTESNAPTAILQGIAEGLQKAWQTGDLEPIHLLPLDATLTEFSNIQGGCERIKNTPVPLAYTMLTHRIVMVYSTTLPLGLLDTVGVFTPIVVLIVCFAFIGLDSVGSQIEDPFEEDPNDLPLSAISRMIEINLRQRLGESNLPPMAQPEDGVLI